MSGSRRALRWLLPALAVPVLLLLGFGLTRDARELPSALVGREAPDFRLETVAGDSLSLDDLRGRVAVLNFWASWCIPCRQEHPVLLRAAETYPSDSVVVAGIVYQDSRDNAARFMEALGGEWPSGLDPSTRTAIDFGVYGVPETFFLAPDGTVARKQVGPVTWEVVSGVVDSLLAAQPERAPAGTPETADELETGDELETARGAETGDGG